MKAPLSDGSDITAVELTGGRMGLPLLIHVSRVESHRAKLIGWHSHEGFELLFLLQGATTYEFRNQQPIELRGGHFLVILPRLAHRGLHNVRSPSTICGLAINPDAAKAGDHTTFTRGDLARLSATLRHSHREPHPFSPGPALAGGPVDGRNSVSTAFHPGPGERRRGSHFDLRRAGGSRAADDRAAVRAG